VLLCALALAASAVAGFDGSRTDFARMAFAKRPLLSIGLPVLQRLELINTRRLVVKMRLPKAAKVRATPVLRVKGRPVVSLGRTRTVALAGGRSTVVSLPLNAGGVSALQPCPVGQVGVIVAAASLGIRQTTARALQLHAPDCRRFFGRAAIWNAPIPSNAPLDNDSSAVIRDVLAKVNAGYRTGMPPTINTDSYAPSLYTVAAGQRPVRVRLDSPPDHAPSLAQALTAVPMPVDPRPAPGSDSELVVWQPRTDTMWEFWRLRRDSAGWVASWGGKLSNVTKGPGYFAAPHPNWGATATSLPLAGGMITPRELQRGEIDHALSMALPHARAGVFSLPAQRSDGDGSCPHAVPEGARLRLDPSLDVNSLGLPGPIAAMARAAQRYGIYLRDQSDSVSFYAQSAASLPSDPYPALFGGKAPYELLKTFPWSHLQLMPMDLRKVPGAGPITFPPLFDSCG
jgi:hypothetical protein